MTHAPGRRRAAAGRFHVPFASSEAGVRGYMIFELEIIDAEAWAEYRRVAGPMMVAAGGRFIVRSEEIETLEGDWAPATLSVVEFPSFEAARAFYHSDAYQSTLPLRRKASRGRGVLVASPPPAA